MPTRPWTPDDDAALEASIRAGDSRSVTASKLGRGPLTVRKRQEALGLPGWGPEDTALLAANRERNLERQRLERQARLDAITDRHLTLAEGLAAQAMAPVVMFQYVGKDGDRVEDELSRPLPVDQERLVRASVLATTAALKVIDRQAPDQLDSALSMLEAVVGAARASADQDEPDTP